VHISRLRAKLATDANVRIHAVAGLGDLLERCSQPREAPPGEIPPARTESGLSSGVTGLRATAND
jgi:hypothetical protein